MLHQHWQLGTTTTTTTTTTVTTTTPTTTTTGTTTTATITIDAAPTLAAGNHNNNNDNNNNSNNNNTNHDNKRNNNNNNRNNNNNNYSNNHNSEGPLVRNRLCERREWWHGIHGPWNYQSRVVRGPCYAHSTQRFRQSITLSPQEWSIIDFPCSLTRNITSHSMNSFTFHNFLRWKMIILPLLTKSLTHFSH